MSAPEHDPTNIRLSRVLSIALAMSPSMPAMVSSVWLVGSLAGCKGEATIPGTEIPDTEDNRRIISVLERYRTSFVSRDAAAVLATAHPTYQDNAGTDDPSDDTTYTELGSLLRRRLSQLDSIRFTIDYLEIQRIEDRAIVRVWIDASYRFKPLLDAYGEPRMQSPYARVMDHSEFELVREGDNWLIVRGL